MVLEARESTFSATSKTCTGCIHHSFTDDDVLVELGKYSFALWEKLAKDDDEIRTTTGLRFQSVFGLMSSSSSSGETGAEGDGGGSDDVLPDWFRSHDAWTANREFLGAANAMM